MLGIEDGKPVFTDVDLLAATLLDPGDESGADRGPGTLIEVQVVTEPTDLTEDGPAPEKRRPLPG